MAIIRLYGGEISLRYIISSLVSSLSGDGDRYGGRITATGTAAGSEGIGEGVGWVWGGWGRYSEANDHGRGGGCVDRWAKNGEK
eukprot:scaffold129022_cov67-Cyclotella_meneghiniana.AAC.3